jgi:hypothetical protein
MAIQKITVVDEIEASETQWWFLYEEDTKELRDIPIQCSGYISSPRILILADTEEELLSYIEENDLTIPSEEYEDT